MERRSIGAEGGFVRASPSSPSRASPRVRLDSFALERAINRRVVGLRAGSPRAEGESVVEPARAARPPRRNSPLEEHGTRGVRSLSSGNSTRRRAARSRAVVVASIPRARSPTAHEPPRRPRPRVSDDRAVVRPSTRARTRGSRPSRASVNRPTPLRRARGRTERTNSQYTALIPQPPPSSKTGGGHPPAR